MRACILGCASTVLDDEERCFFSDADPFGFILFARNCVDDDQMRRLVEGLRESVGREAPVLIDEEGGRVQRMKPPQWRDSPAPGRFGDIHARDPGLALELARTNARLIAEDLFTVGINVNCSPLLDLQEAEGHAVIGDRAFSTEPEIVVALARAWIDGLRDGGVVPVIKHLPGHGRAQVDSHHALPLVDAPLEDLEARDFTPFRAFREASVGMTGHLLFSAIDPDSPATLSSEVINGVVRERIGFDGLLMTDDVSMSALEGGLAERSARSIAAGCDVALHCNGDMAEMREVAGAVAPLSGAALRRAQAMLDDAREARRTRSTIDRDQARADFEKKFAAA